MDTLMISLPPEVGDILMGDITVVEIISMFAVGSFMAVEVALSTLNQFKRYRGLYFWSMQIAAWGIVMHGITAQVRYMSKASNISMAIPFVLGWYCMVQGQAVVLYSRLHLVVSDICHIRWVLWMILANFFILSVPMTALFLCQNLGNNPKCATPAAIFDRIQGSGFAIQDMVISGIYIREALRALKPIFAMKGRAGRSVIYQLIIINVIVVGLNTTLVVTELKVHFITVSYKTVVYSIKLKLEFFILSKLRELTRTYPCVCHPGNDSPRVSSDINIFDLLARGGPRAQGVEMDLDLEAQASPRFAGAVSPIELPRSKRSSTYDFHEALRETSSASENSIQQLHMDGRMQVRSSDTRSTVEMRLVESP